MSVIGVSTCVLHEDIGGILSCSDQNNLNKSILNKLSYVVVAYVNMFCALTRGDILHNKNCSHIVYLHYHG